MPNIFQRVINFFQRKSYLSLGQSLIFGETVQKPTSKDYLDAFEASFLVHACVTKIAEKVANTEFKLYKVGGRAGSEKIKEEKSHALLDLLAQVNPFTTQFAMLDLTQTYLELLGNAYWYKVRAEGSKKILELWALRPDWVTIKQDETSYIKFYEYRMPNGQTQQFKPEDIIHFKQTNPKSSLYGLPTIKSAMDVVRTSIYATRWNMNFFNNSAIPDTLMITKTTMTPDEKKEFRLRWEDKYQGYKNAHKLGILSGEVEFKQLMMTMRDMEFSKLTDTTTQQILTAFGVPKPIVAMTTDMNRATAETAVYTFLSETIEPKIKKMVETLNEFLVPEFGEDLHLDFEDPTPENREVIVKEYESALKSNWMLINEVRDLEGLPPIKGGWDFYLPMMMLPVGGSEEQVKYAKIKGITEAEYKKQKEEREQERLRKRVLTGKRSLKLKMQLKTELIKYFIQNKNKILKPFTDDQKKSWWEEHNNILKGDEKLFVVFARKLFKSQEGRIKEAVESEFTGKSITKAVPDLVNWDIENRIFFELAVPIFTDITERRGRRAGELIGVKFELTEDVIKKIDKKSMTFAEQVNETTRKKLKKELGEGITAGEGVPELAERVSDVFKTRRKYEAERIARTEVISASNAAELEAYIQSDVIEKKEWLATMDANVRPAHADMNGEVVGLNKRFSNGLMYPGDPSGSGDEVVNCRCTTLPVIE